MAELDLTCIAASSIATPAAGVVAAFSDSTGKKLSFKDENGYVRSIGHTNFSIASQSPAATTLTYLTGSALAIPSNKVQAGTCFRWRMSVTKTGAGTAASTYDIRVGTAGTTADSARCTFTKPAGTAAADAGTIQINATIRSIGAAGVMVGNFWMGHNLSATGHMTIPNASVTAVSAGFDTTVANLIFGITVTSGASDALTFEMVQAEAWNI